MGTYASALSSLEALAPAHALVPALLAPRWPSPVGVLDLYSAHRLSLAVYWTATANGKRKERAAALQEVVGILVVLFGGETFLSMCTGQPPSWLLDPTLALVFSGIHLLQTRTPLAALLPAAPSYRPELVFSIPDAIGRTLLLTRFSVVPLLSPNSALPPTPASLLLVPFILAVPAAALMFTGTDFFTPHPRFTTPAELRPWGWTALDAWIPLVLPALFLTLIGPVDGWPRGAALSSDAAMVVCMIFASACFLGRTWWNLAPRTSRRQKQKQKRAKRA